MESEGNYRHTQGDKSNKMCEQVLSIIIIEYKEMRSLYKLIKNDKNLEEVAMTDNHNTHYYLLLD